MSEDAAIPGRRVEVGQMPTPKVVETQYGDEIRIKTFSSDRELKEFASSVVKAAYDLTVEEDREAAADVIARIKVNFNIDAAVGPEFRIDHRDIPVLTEEDQRGSIYIDSRHERNFGLIYRGRGLPGISYERQPEYDRLLPKVRAVIPKPAPPR